MHRTFRSGRWTERWGKRWSTTLTFASGALPLKGIFTKPIKLRLTSVWVNRLMTRSRDGVLRPNNRPKGEPLGGESTARASARALHAGLRGVRSLVRIRVDRLHDRLEHGG